MPHEPHVSQPVVRHAWQALLDGAPAQEAIETVEAIAHALAGELDFGESGEHSLAGGRAGIAVFFNYLGRVLPDRDDGGTSETLLDESVDAVARVRMDASLYGGFPGVGWAIAHVTGPDPEPDIEHPSAEIDQALRDLLARSPWTRDYDLVFGLTGLGVYALERLPDPVAADCLELVVDRLDELAERTTQGATWHTRPELLPADQAADCPDGHYNLGLAHGVPGPIALLGAACAAGVAEAKARPLLDEAAAWLLAQELGGSGRESRFVWWLPAGDEPSRARTAWCYGEPGIAAAMLMAAQAVGSAGWEREALEIAGRAAQRPLEESGVIDAGLCHGAAGLGHLFNRMSQSTGDQELARAARYWLEQALAMRRPGSGVAGFSARWPKPDGTERSERDPGLLTGAAGIGLALLAAISNVEPAWDRILLLSVP